MKKFFALLVILLAVAGYAYAVGMDNYYYTTVDQIFDAVNPGAYGSYKCDNSSTETFKDYENKMRTRKIENICDVTRLKSGTKKYRECGLSTAEIIRRIKTGKCTFKKDTSVMYKCQKGYTICNVAKYADGTASASCGTQYKDDSVGYDFNKTGEDVQEILRTWWCTTKF